MAIVISMFMGRFKRRTYQIWTYFTMMQKKTFVSGYTHNPMKIHVSAESERGKTVAKSGNEFLDLKVIDENRVQIARLRIYPKKDAVGEYMDMVFDWAEHVYINGQHGLDAKIVTKEDSECRCRCHKFDKWCQECLFDNKNGLHK